VKTYDIFATFTGQASDGLQDVNGYIMSNTSSEVGVTVVPYGTEYPAPLVTSSQPNQKDGITNGTFTSEANATASSRPATTISGQGSGATFVYVFDANGDLSSIKADGAGTGYLEGDHLSITTTSAHGSQTIKFRLVLGSNKASVTMELIHDAKAPAPFAVRQVQVNGDTDKSLLFLRERS
jgi:hypothetical protein|tara:strand:+ start:93 stop:635 length:543 start_codon:yes stop_codon:yes gene_type:complete